MKKKCLVLLLAITVALSGCSDANTANCMKYPACVRYMDNHPKAQIPVSFRVEVVK